ncbi:MAG: DUF2088 domain-containing protein, partial [Abditibacteriota bacterium]|nr:DUF2088 domain-containing protein [Abditibacteriota bacterium]
IIAPLAAAALEAGGISDITFLVATSRPLTEEYIQKRFGKKLQARYPVISNTPDDPLSLRDLGYSEGGTRLYLNNTATEAELLISIGQIAPSHIAGFTGGAETILPGVAGSETVSRLYWESGLVPDEEILADNPIRAEMDLAAKRAGLNYIINAIVNSSGEPVAFVAGHPEKAFRAGALMAEHVFGAYYHEHADVVLCASYPDDSDLWSASKALFAAGLMVKPGGVIILVSPCSGGVSKEHPQVEEFGYRSETETVAALQSGELTDFAAFGHLLRVGRLIKEKASCIMVKNAIDRDTVIKLGFKYSATPQRAVDRALKIMGAGARIAALKEGGRTLPVYMQVSRF